MKKILSFVTILALLILTMTACSSGQDADKAPEPTAQTDADAQSTEPTADTQTYFGKIKQVVGNEITLDLAENPIDDFETGWETDVSAESGSGSVAAVQMTAAMPAGSTLDEPVEEHMELTYTGEEKAFTVPAGVQIYDLSHGQDVQLSALKKGAVVMVTAQGETNVAAGVEIWE